MTKLNQLKARHQELVEWHRAMPETTCENVIAKIRIGDKVREAQEAINEVKEYQRETKVILSVVVFGVLVVVLLNIALYPDWKKTQHKYEKSSPLTTNPVHFLL